MAEQRLRGEHKSKIKTIRNVFRERREYVAVLKQEHDILKRDIWKTGLFRSKNCNGKK